MCEEKNWTKFTWHVLPNNPQYIFIATQIIYKTCLCLCVWQIRTRSKNVFGTRGCWTKSKYRHCIWSKGMIAKIQRDGGPVAKIQIQTRRASRGRGLFIVWVIQMVCISCCSHTRINIVSIVVVIITTIIVVAWFFVMEHSSRSSSRWDTVFLKCLKFINYVDDDDQTNAVAGSGIY